MGVRRPRIRQEDVTRWSRVTSVTRRGLALGFFVLLGWSGVALASVGSDWLASQQQTDGSITNGSALVDPVQSTAEALLAFQSLGETTRPGIPAALGFLSQGGQGNIRYLARLIMVEVKAGVDTTALVNTLVSQQNADGGFGFQAGYQSSNLDTAYALEAMGNSNFTSSSRTAAAVAYLLNQRQASGGWAIGDNDPSANVTAEAFRTLWPYRFEYTAVPAALAAAQNFLLALLGLTKKLCPKYMR